MSFKKTTVATLVGAALALPMLAQAADTSGIQWAGSVYMKFLDGNRHSNNGLYGLGGTYPQSPDGGDQGQATEFELLFSAQVSKQVEMKGRLQSRFNRNYWANFGGFGPGEEMGGPCDTSKPETCQDYSGETSQAIKLRGLSVILTPGYDWVDSATIGSNDFGQFDAFTIGKMRYIDRDNGAGFVFTGSFGDGFRWTAARASLPKLWAGPGWASTKDSKDTRSSYNTSLFAQDAVYGLQLRYNGSDLFNFMANATYGIDEELDQNDNTPNDGRDTRTRTQNRVIGGVFNLTPSDAVTVGSTLYFSDWKVDSDLTNVGTGATSLATNSPQWTPYLNEDATDWTGKLNLELNNLGIDDLTISAELFRIGSRYQSVMAARRESDVLLTEGQDGLFANRTLGEGSLGVGGWNGASHQVATLNADNEFTDFDESAAVTAIGWQGLTIVPKYEIAGWALAGEFSYIDYDSNWQNWDKGGNTIIGVANSPYPVMEADGNQGLGAGWRTAYAPFQDRTTLISVLKWDTTFDLGAGLDYFGKFKFVDDADNRVTDTKWLTQAYGNVATKTSDDDRDMEYMLLENGVGYSLTDQLHGKVTYSYYDIDVNDGNFNLQPVGCQSWDQWGPCAYQTGKHDRHSLLFQFDYTLQGLELGSNFQWIVHHYDPEFQGAQSGDYKVDTQGSFVNTAFGKVYDEEQTYRQYRMKTWMKVKF